MFKLCRRKGAPEVRPYVPVWLAGEADGGEFVRGSKDLALSPGPVAKHFSGGRCHGRPELSAAGRFASAAIP